METDDLVFKWRLTFDICCMTSEEKRAPQIEEDLSLLHGRLEKLGALLCCRFYLAGDLADISKSILYQQKVVHLTLEGHADIPVRLNNLGTLF